MKFFVFSFNRADCLRNCIRSIEACVSDAQICIVDDNSYDPETVATLKELQHRHEIIHADTRGKNVRGGLYPNMQLALDSMDDEQTFCFLQDDMQMVRPVAESELLSIHQQFLSQLSISDSSQKPIAFMHPIFLKGQNKRKDQKRMKFDETTDLYFRQGAGTSSRRYFAAVLISNSTILRKFDWQFEATELANDQKAAVQFERLGFLASPFAMWLPNVPVWRGKKKTLAIKLAEKRNKCGMYPFRIMTDAESIEFRQRDKTQVPFAEAFLDLDYSSAVSVHTSSKIAPLKEPWRFSALSGEKLLQFVHNCELRLASRNS